MSSSYMSYVDQVTVRYIQSVFNNTPHFSIASLVLLLVLVWAWSVGLGTNISVVGWIDLNFCQRMNLTDLVILSLFL